MKNCLHKNIASLLLVFTFLCISNLSHAQKFVQVISDEKLDTLIEKNIESNKTINGIQGYRIQIFFGSERKAAHDAKNKFALLNPEYEAYLIYQQPYFKVRVGDFRTKLEAQALFKKVLPEFERVFIIPDKINLPKL